MGEAELRLLMVASMAGNGRAHAALLSGCATRLRGYYSKRLTGRHEDVEDLVQDTLIVIHKRRESYDPALPFTPWLHGIARFKLIDFFRRNAIRQTVSLDDVPEAPVEDDSEAVLARIDIERLLVSLPARQAEAIRLTRLNGMAVKEAAQQSGQSESGIKIGVHRGLRKLMTIAQGSN